MHSHIIVSKGCANAFRGKKRPKSSVSDVPGADHAAQFTIAGSKFICSIRYSEDHRTIACSALCSSRKNGVRRESENTTQRSTICRKDHFQKPIEFASWPERTDFEKDPWKTMV